MNARDPNEATLLEQALTFTSGEARAAYLQGACGGDAGLRARVESLIRAHEAAGGFLPDRAVANGPTVQVDPPGEEGSGDRIGRYKLLQPIGEGGCGVVYMAEQLEPVRRRVALKVIKLGMDTRSVIARFEAERQALALMDHPNIAKVLDAGTTEDPRPSPPAPLPSDGSEAGGEGRFVVGTGRPYFVMELVRGMKITDYCDQKNLSTRERLDLFIPVCHAIQHAHQKGIIHRDIKPSNILVTLHDGVPVPKVIDFGIAKATSQQRLTDKTLFTAFEQFIGTPAYMSPEQAEMSGLDIDTRSDIYSLGVLLYELLTGKTPFDAQTLLAAGLDEMRRIIREQEPVRPSTRLHTLAAEELTTTAKHRHVEAPRLVHLLQGDLDWIVMKCLEKDRTRRYETANGLAADVARHLEHEPVVARPASFVYRFQKAWKRNKLVFTAAAAVAVALVGGIAVSTWQGYEAWKARRIFEAFRSEQIAEEQAVKEEYGDNSLALAHAMASLERGDTWTRRRVALSALWKAPTRFSLPRADELEPAGYLSFSPDGKRLVTGSRRPQVLVWPSDGGDPQVLPVVGASRVLGATFSPGGRWLLSSHATNGSLHGPYQGVLWDGITLEQRQVWNSEAWAPFWFHPDEAKLLAYSLLDQTNYPGVAWWPVDGTAPIPLGSPRAESPLQLYFPPYYMFNFYPSADLRWLASWEGTNVYISSLDATSLGPRVRVGSHEQAVKATSLDAAGHLISSADQSELRIWSRAEPGRPLLRAPAAWTPAIFDLSRARVFTTWPNPNLSAVSYDLRGPIGARPLPFFPAEAHPDDPCSLPGRDWIAVGASLTFNQPRGVFLYPMRTVWPFHVDLNLEPASEPRGGRLAPDGHGVVMERNGRLLLLDLQSPDRAGRVVFESPEQRWIYTWKYDRSGEQLIVGTLRSWAWLVRLEDGQQTRLPDAPKESAAVAFSPSGNRVAVGGGPQSSPEKTFARVLDRDGHLLARLDAGSGENIHDLEFLTETELVVATPKALWWWNTDSNEVRLLRNEGHGTVIVSEHYVLSDTTQDVWLYDRATLTGRALVDMEAGAVTSLAIAPDESFVVAGNYDGSFRVRHLAEDRPHYLPGVQDVIWDLWIDPQGHWIAAIAGKDLVTYWPVPRGRPLHDRPLEEFLEVLRAQTNLRVVTDPDDPQGYRETATAFPGWETVPTWQEWYSEEYMEDPPWKPMLDLEALETAKRSRN